MSTQISIIKLTRFLHDAKCHTYAALDDDATVINPLLNGSNQLEWQDGDWFYQDIYYGMSLFTGMEVVYFEGKPIWSMSYSGGTRAKIKTEEEKAIYEFLRSALMKIPKKFPVRGPSTFSVLDFSYNMNNHGGLASFSGQEEVSLNGVCCYALTFAGGLIR